MHVCMYACMYVMYVCMYVYMHACNHICIRACLICMIRAIQTCRLIFVAHACRPQRRVSWIRDRNHWQVTQIRVDRPQKGKALNSCISKTHFAMSAVFIFLPCYSLWLPLPNYLECKSFLEPPFRSAIDVDCMPSPAVPSYPAMFVRQMKLFLFEVPLHECAHGLHNERSEWSSCRENSLPVSIFWLQSHAAGDLQGWPHGWGFLERLSLDLPKSVARSRQQICFSHRSKLRQE